MPTGVKLPVQQLHFLLPLSWGRSSLYLFAGQDRKEKKSFFNWFYLAINIGSLLAVSVVVYIQESIGWAVGFAIPAACMLLAIVTFVAGSGKYTHVEPTERSVVSLEEHCSTPEPVFTHVVCTAACMGTADRPPGGM